MFVVICLVIDVQARCFKLQIDVTVGSLGMQIVIVSVYEQSLVCRTKTTPQLMHIYINLIESYLLYMCLIKLLPESNIKNSLFVFSVILQEPFLRQRQNG